jgi:hypothetical protein
MAELILFTEDITDEEINRLMVALKYSDVRDRVRAVMRKRMSDLGICDERSYEKYNLVDSLVYATKAAM